jgi:hypothetical protein
VLPVQLHHDHVARGGLLSFDDFRQWRYNVALFDDLGASWGNYAQNIIVNVVNVNDPPVLTALAKSTPSFKVLENATDGQTVIPSLLTSAYISDPDAGQRILLSITNITAIFNDTDVADIPQDGFETDVCGGEISMKSFAGLVYFGVSPNYTVALMSCDTGTPSLCVEWFIVVEIVEANRPPAPTNDTVVLFIPENSPTGTPTINPDQSGGAVAVDGNTPTSPREWRTLTFVLVSNPGGVFAINASTGIVSVLLGGPQNLDFESGGDPTVTLLIRVTDGGGLSAFFTAVITMTDENEPPFFDPVVVALPRSVDESTPLSLHESGEAVGDPLAATDVDAADVDLLVYTLVSGGAGLFDINSTTGQIFLTAAGAGATAFDFERGTRVYNLTVRVTDASSVSATTSVLVRVNDVNEVPTALPINTTLNENREAGSQVAVLNGTDPEQDDMRYFLGTEPDAAAFTIQVGTANLIVTNASLLDFERKRVLSFTYTARDTGRPGSTSNALTSAPGNVTIWLSDVNEAPTFTNSTCSVSVPENAPSGAWLGRLFAVDPDAGQASGIVFSIAASSLKVTQNPAATTTTTFGTMPVSVGGAGGGLLSAASFDFEATTAVSVTARATDAAGLFSSLTCTVSITDVPEAPLFASASQKMYLPKDAALGFAVGTAIAADSDVGDVVSYSVVSPTLSTASAEFAVNNATGAITTKISHASPNQLSSGALYLVYVEARDTTGLSSVILLNISVTDVNAAPAFSSSTFSRSVAENVATGTTLTGGAVTATDADPSDQSALTYSIIGGNSGSMFAIGSSSGVITTVGAPNFEAVSSYTLTVQVTDPGQLSGTATVTVSVTDVNEAPSWSSSNLQFAIDENPPSARSRAPWPSSPPTPTPPTPGASPTSSGPPGRPFPSTAPAPSASPSRPPSTSRSGRAIPSSSGRATRAGTARAPS